MTSVTSTQSLIADARTLYNRDQQQQASITGKKPAPEPSDQELIATDPSLEAAIVAAEDASSSTSGGVAGAHGSPSNGPAGGAGGLAAVKAAPPTDGTAVSAALNGVNITA